MSIKRMKSDVNEHKKQVCAASRFEFGKNWQRFLLILDEDRILEAERSLKQMLETDYLNGKSFLDVGSGSGLFSFSARRLGARVHSFDFDPLSVACMMELKRRYFPSDGNRTIEQGDVLNLDYLKSLGQVVKRFYNRSSNPLTVLIVFTVGAHWETRSALSRLVRRKKSPSIRAMRRQEENKRDVCVAGPSGLGRQLSV